MRIMQRMTVWTGALLCSMGCAGAGAARPPAGSPPLGAEQNTQLERLSRAFDAQSQHMAELEARLSLLEQESRERRADQASTAAPSKPEPPTHEPRRRQRRAHVEAEAEADDVPVVRLYEPAPDAAPALELPEPPAGVPARLPVVPLPQERAQQALAGAESGASAREQYRSALHLVREQRWEEAERALGEFLARFPGDALAAGATYWRGEVYYAQRRYHEALQEFQAVLSRFGSSARAADSLLKLALCHRRLGDQDAAQRYFRQVIEQYPTSDAARIASREGSS